MLYEAQTLEEIADRNALLSRSGLEFMRDVLAGKLPVPPIGPTLGFAPVLVEPGRVDFEGAPGFSALNPMRGVHGGWYGAILDSAMGCATMTLLERGQVYTTLEFKVNITRALPVGMVAVATGVVQHGGRRTAVATAELHGKKDGALYATGSSTCLIMTPAA